MVSLSFNDIEILHETLQQIKQCILMLQEWNEGLQSQEEWVKSSSGMQKLAANCMVIEAIGEAVKKIEKRAGREFLNQRPEIPWQDVMSMRNRIAHGYLEIEETYVFSIIKEDLEPLLIAIQYLIDETEKQMIERQVDEQNL